MLSAFLLKENTLGCNGTVDPPADGGTTSVLVAVRNFGEFDRGGAAGAGAANYMHDLSIVLTWGNIGLMLLWFGSTLPLRSDPLLLTDRLDGRMMDSISKLFLFNCEGRLSPSILWRKEFDSLEAISAEMRSFSFFMSFSLWIYNSF